jgi:hypothetical protein
MSPLLLLSLLSDAAAGIWTVRKDGSGDFATLTAAVAAASDGDTLEVGAGTWAESLTLEGKALSILAVDGAAVTELDPAGAGTWAFKSSNTGAGTVRLEGFTVRNAGYRGVFATNTDLELVDCLFDDLGNSALVGGAIAATGGVSLLITGSTFTGGAALYGAHIYSNGGSLFIEDSRFSLGSSTYGGSIYTAGTVVELWNSELVGNTASNHGGAAWFDSASLVTAEGLTVEGNTSTGGYGGAFFMGYASELILRASSLSGNAADAGYGGAIMFYNYSSGVISGSDFSSNQAYGGGALGAFSYIDLSLDEVEFTSNYAIYGGVLYGSTVSSLSVEDSLFLTNTALYNGGVAYAYSGDSWVIRGSTFEENLATYGSGGALSIGYMSSLTLSDNVYAENRAYYSGGALYLAYVGVLAVLSNETWTENEAVNGGGGAAYLLGNTMVSGSTLTLDGNAAAQGGGGLLIEASNTAFRDLVVTGNVSSLYGGGGVAVRGGDFSLREANLSNNQTGDAGGGFSGTELGLLELVDVDLDENEAAMGGGGLHLREASSVALTRLRVRGNTAPYGGGLYLRGVLEGQAENILSQQNDSTTGAGLCLLEGGALTLRNAALIGNRASVEGSALYAWQAPFTLINSVVAYNSGGSAAVVGDDAEGSEAAWVATHENSPAELGGALTAALYTDKVEGDPLFARYDGDGNSLDDTFTLSPESPLRDAGDPSLVDPDGSRSDIGLMGGPNTWTDDADGDGVLAWLDCDEGDAAVYPGAPEVWYDGADSDCQGSDYDQDGDGVDAAEYGGEDCDDLDASRALDCGEADSAEPVEDEDSGAPVGAEEPAAEGGAEGSKGGCSTSPARGGLSMALLALLLRRGRRARARPR